MHKIIALCGSLRAASINREVLQILPALMAGEAEILLWPNLGSLPFYNPDWEAAPPRQVADLRAAIGAADSVLIASPEYAHGITGVLKNALDCLVSSECMISKPVALLNTAARAIHAQAALREVLSTMSARVIEDACLCLPLHHADEKLQALETQQALRDAIHRLCLAAQE